MDLITHAIIQGQEYPINTSFKVAMECDQIVNDPEINDTERTIALIVKLFGINCPICEEALQKAQIYLGAGEVVTNEPKVMDYRQDWDLLYSAFKSQYDIDLYDVDLHYQKFIKLLKGLKKQVINDVIELRTYDLSDIKDHKTKKKIIEAQKKVALKKEQPTVNNAFLDLLDASVKGG